MIFQVFPYLNCVYQPLFAVAKQKCINNLIGFKKFPFLRLRGNFVVFQKMCTTMWWAIFSLCWIFFTPFGVKCLNSFIALPDHNHPEGSFTASQERGQI